MESIEFEYVHLNKQKLSAQRTMSIGVYVLLDCMDMVEVPTQEPLFRLLDSDAFKEDNEETYRTYLGKEYSSLEEKQFKNYIYYIYTIFNQPVNAIRTRAVAKYVVGEPCDEPETESDLDDVYSSSSESSTSSSSDSESYNSSENYSSSESSEDDVDE